MNLRNWRGNSRSCASAEQEAIYAAQEEADAIDQAIKEVNDAISTEEAIEAIKVVEAIDDADEVAEAIKVVEAIDDADEVAEVAEAIEKVKKLQKKDFDTVMEIFKSIRTGAA